MRTVSETHTKSMHRSIRVRQGWVTSPSCPASGVNAVGSACVALNRVAISSVEGMSMAAAPATYHWSFMPICLISAPSSAYSVCCIFAKCSGEPKPGTAPC
jgi:hypothetical protein